ncbi:unnamed protein product [Schistosoma mattheei]|uniref:Uncharacterized protein n=1 Tax=Schistosoma mattheei TaxID=31246 RepID=A0A183NRW3_9TREM|nr:unnamed protein product [Schistosoma mattheei]
MNSPDIKAAHTDMPIDFTPSTIEETGMAIRQVKSGKAAQLDNIPAKALKSDMEVTANMLHVLFGKIWEEEQVPLTNWNAEHLSKITKKEDLSKCENYREITLLSVPGMVFNSVLLNWMEDSANIQLRDQQTGSRKDLSCTEQIATLRIIVEQSVE